VPLRPPPAEHLIAACGLAEEDTVAKPAEYREMNEEQLTLALREMEKNLFHLRFQSATERLETPSEMVKARRDIARIKTVQREGALLRELLGKLPAEEAAQIEGLPHGRRLAAARSAVKQAAVGGK
jgi:large subunit ribosomal protein L29